MIGINKSDTEIIFKENNQNICTNQKKVLTLHPQAQVAEW